MDDSDTEEQIYRAFALMHSTEKNSGEELRMMLDSLIANKFNSEQTLTTRMPRNFLKKAETSLQIPGDFYELDTSSGELHDMKSMKIFTTESDDSMDSDQVPRISIPDEVTVGEAFCLVCNESKLGPFILLECQNCLDVYHPLCHQPPLVEIDVYDPELIWFCGRCSENSIPKKSDSETRLTKKRIEEKSKSNKSQNWKRKIEDT